MSNPYIPHGHCYLWQTNLVFLHLLSDLVIAIAYYSIPVFLFYFTQQRKDIPFKGIFVLFSVFILSCGTSHLFGIWTLWHPNYWIAGVIKAFTALVSIYTVFEMIPILPQALDLPSPSELEKLNQELIIQVAEKEAVQQEIIKLNYDLDARIQERTKELEQSKYFVEKVINLIPNIVYIYDLIESRIIYCNNYFTEILGYTSNRLAIEGVKFMTNICHPDDLEIFDYQIVKPDTLKLEYRLQDIKGEWHWLENKNYIFTKDDLDKPREIISIASEITEIKKSESLLLELNQRLQKQISELQIRNQEMTQLGKINDFLQACNNLEEVRLILGDLLKPLFPGYNGAVFMLNQQNQKMEILVNWGKYSTTSSSFPTEECWALRRGQVYQANHFYPSLYCSHYQKNPELYETICLPMIAQGQIIGLLSLSAFKDHFLTAQEINLAETTATQIALIIANLRLQENLEYQSTRDGLTGLYNRRYLERIFPQYIIQAAESEQKLGLMILDIDYFKRINDVYGHQAGDLVIQKIAIYLKTNLRSEDIICRYGGEEIIAIIPNISLQYLVFKAKQLKTGVSQLKLKYQQETLPMITASFGVAIFPFHGTDSNTLINLADKALYLAKAKGRNRVICAKPNK
ncbi:diguanylate cyclase [Gloeocapsa sp. PCC 73106]|uniref:sensor domain-containing diguanylate cyclase n=1 Tax=Gloeocapsa sp. PCC 73106 TaxID=102232 RepID=UPI0002ACB87F|nr:diguanylate cyclase [Gloeocapsa sp. PCC 73106]ELR99037.1 PAS domain S-box/diguanylate cyclase (GGDEF) domain-containing protein [Gloeocapsa sp. PCC 73106]